MDDQLAKKEESPEENPPEPQWERSGECVRCGKCCGQIVTTMIYQPELKDYLEWLSLHQGVTVRHDKASHVVEVEFKTKCRALRFKRDKALCKYYAQRPKVCQDFPTNPTAARRCKGFVFKPINPAEAP